MKKLIITIVLLVVFVFSCQTTQNTSVNKLPEINYDQLPVVCCVYYGENENSYQFIFCVDSRKLGIIINSTGVFYQALSGKCDCENDTAEISPELAKNPLER